MKSTKGWKRSKGKKKDEALKKANEGIEKNEVRWKIKAVSVEFVITSTVIIYLFHPPLRQLSLEVKLVDTVNTTGFLLS